MGRVPIEFDYQRGGALAALESADLDIGIGDLISGDANLANSPALIGNGKPVLGGRVGLYGHLQGALVKVPWPIPIVQADIPADQNRFMPFGELGPLGLVGFRVGVSFQILLSNRERISVEEPSSLRSATSLLSEGFWLI